MIRHNEVLYWVYTMAATSLTCSPRRYFDSFQSVGLLNFVRKKKKGAVNFHSFPLETEEDEGIPADVHQPDGLLLLSPFGNNHKNWERLLLLLLLASSSLFLGVLWFIITWPRPPWPMAASEAVPPHIPFFSLSSNIIIGKKEKNGVRGKINVCIWDWFVNTWWNYRGNVSHKASAALYLLIDDRSKWTPLTIRKTAVWH